MYIRRRNYVYLYRSVPPGVRARRDIQARTRMEHATSSAASSTPALAILDTDVLGYATESPSAYLPLTMA